MATKNGLFNAALLELGSTTVTDTGENVESARVLNVVYSDVVAECLSAGPWNFASKNAYPTGDTGLITPTEVGYLYGYPKPTDWVRTIMVSDDPYLVFEIPGYFDGYYQGVGIWAADTGELFVRYVSDTGAPLTTWPAYFSRYVALSLAARVCGRLVQDKEKRRDILALKQEAERDALAQNRGDNPAVRFAPADSWQNLYQAIATDVGDQNLLTDRSGEVRRCIDDVIANVKNDCLGKADWNFATKTATFTLATGDTGVRAGGYGYGVAKPTDWVRTVLVSDDAFGVFEYPEYFEGNNYWSSDTGELIVRYVANDTGTAINYATMPSAFRRYLELEAAIRVFPRLASSIDFTLEALQDSVSPADKLSVQTARAEQKAKFYEALIARRDAALQFAVEQDAQSMAQPHFAPVGSWQEFYQSIAADIGDPDLLTKRSGEVRRAITDVLADVKKDCLSKADWNFATRTTTFTLATGDTGVLAAGYTYGVAKPSDWVRTVIVSDDNYGVFEYPEYIEGNNYWTADTGELKVRYIANDTGTGLNTSTWPSNFRRYVELETAVRIFPRLTSEMQPELRAKAYEALASSRDAAMALAVEQDAQSMAKPHFAPATSWQSLYQAIAGDIGDPELLTKRSGETRRVITDVISEVEKDCLGKHDWNFATRRVTLTGDTGDTGIHLGATEAASGYLYGFAKPSDWVKTILVTDDPHGVFKLTDYFEGHSYYSADTGEIILYYVANDTGTSLNISDWPSNFRRYVELETAVRVFPRLSGAMEPQVRDAAFEKLAARRDAAMEVALKQDGQSNPDPHYAPTGSWATLYQEILSEIWDDSALSKRAGQARRVVQDIYSDALNQCLAAAPWNFATKTIQPTPTQADTGVLAGGGIGYVWGYAKPADWVRTVVVSDDPYAVFPLTQYYDGNNYWAADTGQITVRYVANDTGTGKNISDWPPPFRRYFELEVASRVFPRLAERTPENTQLIAAQYENLIKRRDEARTEAVVQNESDAAHPRFAPTASWSSLYQESLTELGDVALLTTRSGEARRALDEVYSQVLGECLEAGSWNFAMETIQADADTGVTPSFGYAKVFAKPSDWVRTVGISGDPYFAAPELYYYDDANFWSADYSPIYVRYVSDDTGLGLEMTRWPDSFKHYVQLELASRVCLRLTKDQRLKYDIDARRDKARRLALNKDALNEPNPKFPPTGSWSLARSGSVSRGDRGSRSNLTG